MTGISYVDRWKNYPGDSIPEHRIAMSIKRSPKFEDLVDITYYSVLEPIPRSSYTTHFFRFLPVKFSEYPPAPVIKLILRVVRNHRATVKETGGQFMTRSPPLLKVLGLFI